MDYTTAQPSEHKLDTENFITKEELIKQLELSGVNLGDDPAARIETYVAAGLLPIPQVGHFPTWTVQRIIAIENKLAEGQSLAEIQKEVREERRKFLSGAKDLNSLVSLYKKFQKNSAFFLFSFLILFVLGMGVVASSIVAPGNPVAVAGEHTVRAVAEGAGKVAKVAAAPVGKTIVTIIKTSVPEDTKSADPLGLTNLENVAMVDDLGNLLITGNITAEAFSGSGEKLTKLPASEVVGELKLATLPWGSVTDAPLVLSTLNKIGNDKGNLDLAAGTGISILSDDSLKTVTITNTDHGSHQFIFKNIAVAGQSTVAADSNDDTLTLVAGANLVITTDSISDSVTFSVTGTVANADTLDLLDSSQFLRSDVADSFTAGTLTFEAGTTLSVLGTFTCTNCVGDAAAVNNLTIDATGSVAAAAVTGTLTDAQVADNITASSYLPLNGGTMAGNIDLATNLLLNIGNAGTDFTAGGGLTLAGLETLSALSISSGARVSNTTNFNPAAGGNQYGYNLSITNAPTVAANTAYGFYTSFTDAGSLVNTVYGGYFSASTANAFDTTYGVFGSGDYGLYGSGTYAGVYGSGTTYGLYGTGGTYGIYGTGTYGFYGDGTNSGVYGAGGTYGVYGSGIYGVYGLGNGVGVNYGIYGDVGGARTATVYSGYLTNTATSSTAGINKYGAYITSTGTWNGAGSNNYALYLADATGGTTNYAIYQAGTTGTNVFKASTQIDNSLTINSVVNPTVKGSVQDATRLDEAYDVYVQGKYAYVTTDSSSRLTVVDISNPSSPTVTGSVYDANLARPWSLSVAGKYAYVTAYFDDRLTVVDVSNPASPTVAGSIQDATNLNFPRAVYASGKYAYVAAYGANRLTIVDVSNPASPSVTGSVQDTNLSSPGSIYVLGRYAYVGALGNNRLTIVDVSNPASPSVAGSIQDNTNLNRPYGVYASGKYVYVAADTANRLTVVDVSNPASPTVAGSVQDNTNLNDPSAIYVSGKYAYVAAGWAGVQNRLTVVDISNPSSPTVSGSISDAANLGSPSSVYISGKYAYVAAYSADRLTIVDLVGIDAPTASIGNISTNDLAVTEDLNIGNNLYVGGGLNVGANGILSQGNLATSGNLNVVGAITAGTTTSTHTLTGMLCIRNATACPAQAAGRLYVDTTGTAGGDDPGDVFDIAEYFPATEAVEKGELVSISPAGGKLVEKSSAAYDPALLGIVSTSPAAVIEESWISLGAGGSSDFNPRKPYIALAGRVPTKVSTENGNIEPGDPLTSSSTAGVAMKATQSGPIVGKALESFSCSQSTSQSTDHSQQTTAVDSSPNAVDQLSDSGQSTVDPCFGKIMVFVSVGWFVQPVTSDQSPVTSNLTSIDVETLTAGTINTQVLFVGERKISMAKDGALKIEGNVEVSGELTAKKLNVSAEASGSSTLPAGQVKTFVATSAISAKSQVLITPDTLTKEVLAVTKKEVGKGFTVEIISPETKDIKFDWFIIN